MQDWFIPYLARGADNFAHSGQRLRRAQKVVQTHSVWDLIAAHLGQARIPVAQAGAVHAGLPADGFWLRADPVYLRPDHKGIYVLGLHDAELTLAQAQTLVDELNVWLAQDGLLLYAVSPLEWYLHSREPFRLRSTALSDALGCDMSRVMIQGEHALRWQSRLMEWQMLLQRSAVNIERQQQGRAVVSSLWLWGECEGEEPAQDLPAPARPWYTDSPWLADYLRQQKQTVQLLEIDVYSSDRAPDNQAFADISSDAIVVLLGPEAHWQAAQQAQIQQWRAFIADQLPRSALNLVADDGHVYHCRPWQSLQFWR